jgi:hypothetical protein
MKPGLSRIGGTSLIGGKPRWPMSLPSLSRPAAWRRQPEQVWLNPPATCISPRRKAQRISRSNVTYITAPADGDPVVVIKLENLLTTSTAVPRGLGTDAIGVAPSPGDGTRGTMAYVFLDKVSSFAASHRLALTHVLACVMAHEIGHLLLPPNAHRPDSVMRDRWHPALFPPRAPGILGFLSTRRDYCVFAQVRSDAAGPRTRQRLCRARGACLF